MTLSEFKAWFEGYTEGLDGAPTEKQFKRIKAKVAEITGTPITQTVFVDRYRDYQRYWGQPTWFGGNVGYSAGSVGQGTGNAVLMNHGPSSGRLAAGPDQTIEATFCNNDAHQLIGSGSYVWDSHAAMYAVGKADALAA